VATAPTVLSTGLKTMVDCYCDYEDPINDNATLLNQRACLDNRCSLAGSVLQLSGGACNHLTDDCCWVKTDANGHGEWQMCPSGSSAGATGALSVSVPSLSAADDNRVIWVAPWAQRVTSVGCLCTGTCTAPVAAIAFEDGGGNGITLSGTLTCATAPTAVTYVTTSSGDSDRDLTTGEALRFDTTNSPGSTDLVTVTVVLQDL
jgi:hypothetical protein